jgi:HEPN domain-containing protein
MQPDAARRADTLAWLRKAEGDLRAAAVDLGADPPLVDDALFHCQQAVEKALKGLLTWHDVPFRKTHSLEELGRQVVALHGELRPLADRASLLSEYAWKFRYPGEVDSPSIAEATEALALAREAHAAVLATLGERLF